MRSSSIVLWVLTLAMAALVLPIPAANAVAPTCTSPRLRKEIRDLNDTEFAAYTRGMNELKRTGRITQYVAIHQQWTQQAHGGVLFLAWHRRFIYQLETELLAITGPDLKGMPYFDPFMSYSIFDPAHPRFIGEAQGCITSGPFRGWISNEGRCLMRALNTSPTFVDPRAMTQLILGDAAFSDFAGTYENGQHADVHSAIGGQMVGLMYSVNDPCFFLHHAHVDQVWYRRQYADTGRLYWDYSGMHTPGGVGQVNLNTPIPPWQDLVGTVTDVYRIMCYDYQDAQQPAEPTGQPAAAAGPMLHRRQLASLRVFNFTHTDPLHPCTPLPADRLAPLGIAPANAQRACDRVNRILDRLQAEGPAVWRMPHEIAKDTRVPSAGIMADGRAPPGLSTATGFEGRVESAAAGGTNDRVTVAKMVSLAVVVVVGMYLA